MVKRPETETKIRVRAVDRKVGLIRREPVTSYKGQPTAYILARQGLGLRNYVHNAERKEVAKKRAELRDAYGQNVRLVTERVQVGQDGQVATKERRGKVFEQASVINDNNVNRYERRLAQKQKEESERQKQAQVAAQKAEKQQSQTEKMAEKKRLKARVKDLTHVKVNEAKALESQMPHHFYLVPGGFYISERFMGGAPKGIVEKAFDPNINEGGAYFSTKGMLARLSKGALNPTGHQNIFEKGVTLLEKVGIFETLLNRIPAVSEVTGTYITGVNLFSSDSARAKRAALMQTILTDIPAVLSALSLTPAAPVGLAAGIFSLAYTQLYNSAKMAAIRDRLDQQIELGKLMTMQAMFTDPELKNSAVAQKYRAQFVNQMTKEASPLHELAYRVQQDVVQPASNALRTVEERIPGLTAIASGTVDKFSGKDGKGLKGEHVHKAIGALHSAADVRLRKPTTMREHVQALLAESRTALAMTLPEKERNRWEVAQHTAQLLLDTLAAAQA